MTSSSARTISQGIIAHISPIAYLPTPIVLRWYLWKCIWLQVVGKVQCPLVVFRWEFAKLHVLSFRSTCYLRCRWWESVHSRFNERAENVVWWDRQIERLEEALHLIHGKSFPFQIGRAHV